MFGYWPTSTIRGVITLQWRHNELPGVSNHQPHDCLLNRLFTRRSKKASKPRVTGLFVGNSPVTGEFLAQRASNAENASIWWRHHETLTQINLQICHCGHAFCGFTNSQLLIWGARKWSLLLTYLNLISVWTSNCIHYKVWGETTYPFPKLQQCNRSTE